MCLEGRGERGLPLLAAHQVGAQQVDDDDVAVQSLQLLEVRVESRSGELRAPGDSDLVGANVDPGLGEVVRRDVRRW